MSSETELAQIAAAPTPDTTHAPHTATESSASGAGSGTVAASAGTAVPAVIVTVTAPPVEGAPASANKVLLHIEDDDQDKHTKQVADSAEAPAGQTKSKGETDLPAAYLSYLSALGAAWHDLPELVITYERLAYEVQVPSANAKKEIPSLATAAVDGLRALNVFRDRSADQAVFHPLHPADGVVRPGELTLILAPPGHGKSTLLKSLAGRLARDGPSFQGEVRWNGLTAAESAAAGQQLTKLCAFVEQQDAHFPMLTVRETFAFALENSNADTALLASPELAALQAKKVELMLELLGLKECADTVVGDGMLRGVSGGQMKRVTLGEMMIGQARALFLDEISTGLDAAATFDVVSALKRWTRVMNGSAMVALLQPAPEVYRMFDRVILMREGHIVFSGSHEELDVHLARCQIVPNDSLDFADWMTEFLTDPAAIWKRDMELHGHKSSAQVVRESFREEKSAPGAEKHVAVGADPYHLALPATAAVPDAARRKGLGQIVTSKDVPLTTAALVDRYKSSSVHSDLLAEIAARKQAMAQRAAETKSAPSAFTQRQYYQAHSWNVWHHTKSCLYRQWQFMSRSSTFVIPRIIQSLLMGLIAGSLFWNLGTGTTDFSPRLGLILYSISFMSFSNMSEVPLASECKKVVQKQVDAGFYSTYSYTFSVVMMHLPMAALETFIFGTTLYYMSSFTDDAGRWWFFVFVLLSLNLLISVIFRTLAYLCSNADVASNLAGPITVVFQMFAGFLITWDKIPIWLQWVAWITPFSWTFRSLALSEFHAEERYPNGLGDVYLDVWQVETNDKYKWASIGFNFGLFLVFVMVGAMALSTKRAWLSIGTRRSHDESVEALNSLGTECGDTTGGMVRVRVGARSTSMREAVTLHDVAAESTGLEFTRMDLTFASLRYTVMVTEQDDAGVERTYERALLTGINGFARAGELTALMGSSGAGKTTLMDCIAGRKNTGKLTGDIRINGHPQEFPAFSRLMGYVEQRDQLIGHHTVRESLDFSAALRLPSTVSAETRAKFVDQIVEDLELTDMQNRLVGDVNIEGLSPGEMKRLTIGVELAANPTFLFLDEPTSGLDSRAALVVLRVIRKIAARGRSVVCTIHQPSAELFTMFDRLLLLKSGGREVYFGPVGDDGIDVVRYFMTASLDPKYYRPSLPEHVNVASWMLDVVGAGTSAKGLIAPYDEVYKESQVRVQNMSTLAQLATPPAGSQPVRFDGVYASSYSTQFKHVLGRLFTVYWRDISYNMLRFFLNLILGIFFGLIYLSLADDDEPGMISKLSVCLLSLGQIGVLNAANAIPIVFRLREVFYRERSSNTYSSFMLSTSMAIVELPYLFVGVMLFCLPLYFLVGFINDGDKFFLFILVHFLVAIYFSYLGQLMAASVPNIQVAYIIGGLCFTFVHLFAGTFIQYSAMPVGWQWMYHMQPLSKGIIAVGVQQFYCDSSAPDAACPTIYSVQMGGRVVTKWEFAANYLTTGEHWDAYHMGYLVLMIVIVRILVAAVIHKVSFLKR